MENIEAFLRAGLRRSKLVYLAFPDDDDVLNDLMNRLRQVGLKLGSLPQGRREIVLRENLATYLVGVTYSAWENYSDGTLWPFVETALGNPSISQQELADFYRFGLDQFGLDRFQVREMRNVSEILLHSGIPRKSQTTYLGRLIRDIQREDDLSAEEFNLRISKLKRSEVASKSLDVPTWRFISQVPDIAQDLTEKCLEVFDDIADDGEWNAGGGEGLPAPLLRAIVAEVAERNLKIKARRKGIQFRQTPAVHLDPANFELKLILPQMEQVLRKPVTWKISQGDEVAQVTCIPELQGLDPRPNEVQINSLVREISLESDDVDQFWNISLFDPETPISFFKLDGRALPDTGSLPGQEVLALVPLGTEGVGYQIQIDGDYSSDYRNYGCPSGWNEDSGSSAWKILGLDLTGKRQIRLLLNGRELEDSTRHIGQALPSFNAGNSELVNLSHQGIKVFSSLPDVILPAVGVDQEFSWTIRLRFSGSESKYSEVIERPCSTEQQTVKIQAPAKEGTFSLSVEGKRGSTQRIEGFILGNAKVEMTPAVRGLTSSGAGITECKYVVSVDGRTLAKAQLDPSQVEDEFLTSEGFTIRVNPFHAELIEVRGSVVVRHLGALNLAPEDLLGCKLKFIWPRKKLRKVVAKNGEDLVQELSIKDLTSMSPFVNLGELSDTAKVYGQLDVFADWGDSWVRVSSIRAKKLVESCSLETNALARFVPLVEVENLVARAYFLDAPWRQPLQLEVAEQYFSLPDHARGLGRIGVIFNVYDHWAPPAWPELYEPCDNGFVLDTSVFGSRGDAEGLLAQWFLDGQVRDGLGSLPVSICARLLMDESMATPSRSRAEVIELARGLAPLFKSDLLPALAMQAAHQSSASVSTLFELDLIDTQFESANSPARYVSSAPYLSLIPSSGSMWATTERAQEWIYLLSGARVEAHNSEEYLQTIGILDRNEMLVEFARQLSDLDFLSDPNALQVARQRLGALPGPPLHRSNLAGIFLNLLGSRRKLETDPTLKPLLAIDGMNEISRFIRRGLPSSVNQARKALMYAFRPPEQLLNMGGNAVMIMPLSLGLAILARFAPKHVTARSSYQELKPLHSKLAHIVPDLVEHDLIVAELLASHNDAFGG